eukprot:SAG11_NODE_35365_length_267_cov_0.541667_1_plen_29_part_01
MMILGWATPDFGYTRGSLVNMSRLTLLRE